MSMLEILLVVAAVIVFAVMAYFKVKQAKQIDAEGIVTDGVVTRIEEGTDSDGMSDGTHQVFVRYTDENGKERESFLAQNMDKPYKKGTQIRIKYLPGNYKMVREA